MATVTDLTQFSQTLTDNTIVLGSSYLDGQSNVNLYEFGNLILGDLLLVPTPGYINLMDSGFTAVSMTDQSGGLSILTDRTISNSMTYDSDVHTYSNNEIDYDGHPSQNQIVDMSGS